MSDTTPNSRFCVREVLAFLAGLVFLGLGITLVAAPELLEFTSSLADGANIRNVMYGIFLIAAGMLLCGYSGRRLRSRSRGSAAAAGGDGSAAAATGVATGAAGAPGEPGGADGAAGTANVNGYGEATAANGAVTPQDPAAAENLEGAVVCANGRIIQLPRNTLDDQLADTFARGCAWLDAGELQDAAFPVALLIPTRAELLDYLAENFPDRTVMMSDHLKKGSGLPYFVSGGVHLHCATLNRPQDVSRMLSCYDPALPLACALVSGSMNLDSRSSEEAQLMAIRHSVIGLLCWHEECGQYLLVRGTGDS